MLWKKLSALGALALVAAVAVAAVVHHGPPGAGTHHGSAQPSSDANVAAVHRARAGVGALGKQWSVSVRDATTELYDELRRQQDSAGIREIANLKYGPHEQQSLDLFVPEGGFSELTTVLVYLHDDGLSPAEPAHGGRNIGTYIARVGGIGVNARYRVGPDAEWLAGAQDVRRLLEWLRANIEPYGGDPHNIVLMGNSTGAAHIATYLFHEPSQLADGPGVTAAILSSGTFGESGDGSAQTPLALIDSYQGSAVPLLIWSAEYDVPSVETSVAELYAKLCRKYADCPMFVQLQGFNHVSHVLSIDSADTAVTDTIMRFYHSVIDAR